MEMKRRSFLAGSLLGIMPGGAFAAATPVPLKAQQKKGDLKANAEKSILELNPPEMVLPMLQNMQLRAINRKCAYQREQLTLLHFADIHNDVNNLCRVMEFAGHYKEYLNDVLLTGDIAGGDWCVWKKAMMTVPGFTSVLKTLGNHDVAKWNGQKRNATPKESYDRYFAGVEKWGVVQPGGTNPEGLCYWYKDYPKSGVRLIGLDCMHYNKAQQSWFVATLEDARIKGFAVVAAQHYPPAEEKDSVGLPNCPFDSLQRESLGNSLPRAVAAVDDFQKAGGEFVCWLGGHTHTDFCGTVRGKKQLYIIVGTAKKFELWCDSRRVAGEKSQDMFNVMSIDTYRKHIRVFRVGAEWNRFLQHRVSMCIDYACCRQVG